MLRWRTGIKRNDASTWGDDRWPPKFFDSGIINRLEVGFACTPCGALSGAQCIAYYCCSASLYVTCNISTDASGSGAGKVATTSCYCTILVQVAHQDFVWKLRADSRITSIFAALWGELLHNLLSVFHACGDHSASEKGLYDVLMQQQQNNQWCLPDSSFLRHC